MSKTPEEMAEECKNKIAQRDIHAMGTLSQRELDYLKEGFLAGYKAAQAIVEEELQAVQAQRVDHPGLGSAEYALKNVVAKMGGK